MDCHRGVDLGQAFLDRDLGIRLSNALAQVIEALPHAPDAGEQFRIDEPFPRRPDFMVSPRFAQYARQLQDSLLRASATPEESL